MKIDEATLTKNTKYKGRGSWLDPGENQCQTGKEEIVMEIGRKWSDRITNFVPHWA